MITTADTRQAIDLAIEAEDRGVSVERLALANDVHSGIPLFGFEPKARASIICVEPPSGSRQVPSST